jgi:hypothetical protein
VRAITTGLMLSAVSCLTYQVYDTAHETDNRDSPVIQDTNIPQNMPDDSLEEAVYHHFIENSIDQNGFQAPLRIWGKSVNDIGQDNFRAHIRDVVALTSDACAKYSFPSDVECVPLMLALFMQESQLYPYATNPYAGGIAQLGVEVAIEQELQLPQGPKYVAWMKARETIGYSDDKRTRRAYSGAISEIARTKHQQAREYELPAFDERYNIECAIPAATAVMYQLLKAQDGNIIRALHAYNFGSANLKKAEDSDTELPDETQRHAVKILRLYEMLRISAF